VRENVIPAGFSGVPHHIHHGAEEAFYVLEGALTIATPDRTVNAPAGSFVLIPRGTVHTLANPGSVPARWLTIISPAWVSAWVEEEDVLLRNAPPGGPDPGEQAAIYRKYGLELVSQGDLTDD
jgi:mannose-6-phosphate isomerase-like protein (cupin superfamily)